MKKASLIVIGVGALAYLTAPKKEVLHPEHGDNISQKAVGGLLVIIGLIGLVLKEEK